ncbi:FmdB family zinc ribbon protein [Paucibacter sp. DJ2R-2]|uniref:FmdB family zinc ribbon protein n=1 Tax=Paucibacter sp. DJ2R-2 TaxID=2893558 RepID=UPI0021E514FC|nr:FmdB family zinc ribbon protein [Paucibacter sp. DJ2R-2]MCV2422793.1 zinc ribbon domain-containing protein [Paucibacter sp. DJ4R-1]MCV2441066.1 zinc ribbon domain-containing protein [Paucibacter sp. DJ2R-2]
MPIYAYRCAECGHAKDVLQKMSDAPLSTCPHCGAEAFQKQVTAAGFQLKGSGWYATDFKGSGSAAAATGATGGVVAGAPAAASASESGGSSGESGGSSASAPTACGGSCACH